ncbi:MAG TPA: hypothetical protein VIU64_15130, partial [Polyangia bacterium]
MALLGRGEIVHWCLFGDGSSSLFDRIAIVATWCLALALLVFNTFFPLLFEDGNLFIRGAGSLILSVPLFCLYVRGRRALIR